LTKNSSVVALHSPNLGGSISPSGKNISNSLKKAMAQDAKAEIKIEKVFFY